MTLSDGKAFSVFYINIDSILTIGDGIKGYFFKSLIFIGDMREVHGIIYLRDNCIYLKAENCNPNFKLFDFNLKVNEKISIFYTFTEKNNFNKIDTINKKFEIFVEDKFFDTNVLDTIYQFRLNNFGIYTNHDDIILFVGKHIGVTGYYLGDIVSDNSINDVIQIYYDAHGNIYKERPYFKKLKEKKFL